MLQDLKTCLHPSHNLPYTAKVWGSFSGPFAADEAKNEMSFYMWFSYILLKNALGMVSPTYILIYLS